MLSSRSSSGVQADDFYRQDHRIIYNAINTLDGEGKPFDLVTVAEWLESHQQLDDAGGLPYLAELAENTPSASNVGVYADIVRKRSILRQLISATVKSMKPSSTRRVSAANRCLILPNRPYSRSQSRKPGANAFTAPSRTCWLAPWTGWMNCTGKKHPSPASQPGFDDFDERTAGLQKSDLIIIAGRPSMGKTAFAVNITEHAAIKEELSVVVFSMEMPGEQLAMRMMSSLGRVDQHKVRTGKLQDDDWPRLTSAVSLLKDKNLFIDDTPALTPAELRARCRRIAREHGLDLIIVDYLQLMQIPGTSENRATEISEISRSLKAMAKELGVPVVALSQLNRSLEQRPQQEAGHVRFARIRRHRTGRRCHRVHFTG